jgi:DNA invertase Pin-like site-specific DNA recombinase
MEQQFSTRNKGVDNLDSQIQESLIYIFGYSRKSPDDKEDTKTSIDNQNKLIVSLSERVHAKLVRIGEDRNLSGGDRFRKGFISILTEAIEFKQKNPDKEVWVATKDQDRFARDSAFFMDTLRDLDARQIKVFSIMKNGFLSNENIDDSIMSVVNSFDIIKNRKKANVLLSQKEQECLPPIPAPFGYKYSKTKNWIIDQKKAEIVKKVYEMNKNGKQFREIITELKIKPDIYYRILRNIEKGLYFGYVVYEKKYRDANKNVIRTEKIKYKGTFEPILKE